MDKITKRYFSGFDSLRFYAASLVVLFHVNTTLRRHGISDGFDLELFNRADEAVSFFFCLSGFLITYLLLFENKTTGKINVKSFYIRRILRIWPLYFVIVGFGLLFYNLILPFLNIQFEIEYSVFQAIMSYVFLTPHYMTHFYDVGMILNPTWSIGIEEQFYLLWAPILLVFSKRIKRVAIFLIVFFLSIVFVASYNVFNWELNVIYLIYSYRFYYMGAGAIGAYLLLYCPKKLHGLWIFEKLFFRLLFLLLIFYFFVGYNHIIRNELHWIIEEIILMFLFVWLLLYFALFPEKTRCFRLRITEYLGKISYGIYLYHCIAITMLLYFFPKTTFTSFRSLFVSGLFYVSVFVITIVFSAVSFKYYESFFLSIKKKNSKN